MTPTERAIVADRLHDMDPEAAARELAIVLRLDRDAEDLIAWAIEESYKNGLCKGKSDVGEPWSEEDAA
jgi:hypothetical protein